MNNRINKISPLPNMLLTIGLLPSSYLVSMTYEEQLLWLCNFLKTEVIPKTNANIEAVNNLITYIDNYFDNLDVQEEIDNKLDEMAESGELASIIAEFLETNAIFGFNTVANMKASENLQSGSICKTLGKLTVLDGEGAFYRIRELINTDVIDEVNIIGLTNYPTLVAELIPYSNSYALYNSLNNNIETLETNLINKTDGGHILVFGDSWTDYAVDSALEGIGWCKALENKTGLIVHNYALNGSAFGNGMFSTQVNTFIADDTYDHKLIDKVIFMGGINDYHLNIGGSDTANNYLSVLNNLITNGNLKENCEIYFINNWSFVNGTYTDATTQITSNDTLELQMNWWHDFFANVQSNENYKTICINTFDWYPYSAWNNTFYHLTESYKVLYQWQQIYSAVYGGQIRKAPYLMKINADFGYVIYKVDNKNSISVIANVWNNQNDMSLTISHNVPFQVDNLKTSNGSVISLNNTSITFTNTGVQQIGYGKFTRYSLYNDIINGSITAS